MIGIFKVNSKKDGGYYIDNYLKEIIVENGGNVISFALHNSKEKLNNYNNILINYKNFIKTILIIKNIISENNIKIYYTNQFITLLYAIFIKIFINKEFKIIAKVDGKTIKLGMKKYFYFLYDVLWDFAKSKADYLIFETQNAKGNYSKRNYKIIYTPATNFYNIIKNEKPKIELKADLVSHKKFDKIALYVGRYSPEKGFQLLESIASTYPNILIITIGGDKKIFGKIENILELGYKNIKDVIHFYYLCDFLIVPSVDDSFPSVIREFSYFNKPILATNVGSIPELQKLGLSINLCEPKVEFICKEIENIITKYQINDNRRVFERWFDPNNKKIISEYLEILNFGNYP